jgi:dihydrofolate reductase
MREVIQSIWISIDGFYEGPKSWDLAFNSVSWGPETKAIAHKENMSAGGLLLGRKTYEGFAKSFPEDKSQFAAVLNDLPKFVFSNTLKRAAWQNTTVVGGDVVRAVRKLKRTSGKPLFIFGSGEFAATLTRHGLIDEYRLLLTPVVLGAGTPLFKPSRRAVAMKLVEARTLKSGAVLLRYRPRKTRIKLRD